MKMEPPSDGPRTCVLVTGASGFIGKALMRQFGADSRIRLRGAYRTPPPNMTAPGEVALTGDLGPVTRWSEALAGVDVVIHCAARVHCSDAPGDAESVRQQYWNTNVTGSEHLAREAARAGCRRLIFLSSVKAVGDLTTEGHPFTETSPPHPSDDYGQSKLAAEEVLLSVSRETGLEVVIVRLPLVYGAEVKANFRRMMTWLRRGVPLPLGAVDNQRSMLSLDNLCDFVRLCLDHPGAANDVFFLSDSDDVSTTRLLRALANAMKVRPRLVPIPPAVLMVALRLVGREDLAQRLLGSLQVDCSKARTQLGWRPVVRLEEALHGIECADVSG